MRGNNITSSSDDAIAAFHSGTAGKGQIRFTDGASGYHASQSWVEYDHSTAKFAIGWNAQTRAFGGPNNEFGLYYNTPSNLDSNAHELVIGGGTGSGGMTLFNSTSGQGNIFFADGIGSAAAKKMGRIVYDHSNDSMQFTTNSSERLRIASTGQVGIATNSPSAAWLDIASDSGSYDHLRLRRLSSDSNVAANWSFKPYAGNLYFRTGGSTDKIFFDDSGDINIMDGNLIIATAGHGIDFSATANGGTGTPSELLDDYEEGYFAPEITNLSSGYGSGTFYNRQARYTKIGNMVNCWVHIQFWGVASTSGSDNLELTVTGFPFEVDGVGYSGSCGGALQSQSWRYSGSGWNNYATTSNNVQPRINSLEQIRFGVCGHNGITGQVTQKSINGYAPNIEFFFSVRVTSYK